MKRTALAILLLVPLCISGCYPEPILINVVMPTRLHFLYADEIDLLVFNLDQSSTDENDPCPELLLWASEGIGDRTPAHEVTVPVCNIQDGGITLENVGTGNRAIVGIVYDNDGNVIMEGCRIGATFENAAQIALLLNQTEEYPSTTERVELECDSVSEKCSRGCW